MTATVWYNFCIQLIQLRLTFFYLISNSLPKKNKGPKLAVKVQKALQILPSLKYIFTYDKFIIAMHDLFNWEVMACHYIFLIWGTNQSAHFIQNHNWIPWVISNYPLFTCGNSFAKLISPGKHFNLLRKYLQIGHFCLFPLILLFNEEISTFRNYRGFSNAGLAEAVSRIFNQNTCHSILLFHSARLFQ